MCFLYIDGRTDHCLGLHLRNLRIGHCQTASAVAHHRVELMQAVDDRLDLLYSLALRVSQLLDVLFLCRNELMQRRIQETDGNRVAFQSLVQLLEVSLLFRKDLLQCCFSLFYGLRTDHLTERINSVAFEEHMLCTAQSDTFSSQLTGFLRVCRCIRIGTYLHGSVLVSPCHDPSELSRNGRVYSRDDAIVDISGRTVDGDRVSFMVFFSCQCELLVLFVHRDIAAAGYTASAHPARYNCRMACHTAANGQDSLCSLHTFDILRRSLQADQNDLFSSCSPLLCVVSGEYDLTAGSSR